MKIPDILIEITAVFLEEKINYLKLSKAVKDYKDLLTTLSGIDPDDEQGRTDMHFENGKALGTTWAARCIDDMMRTRRFIKGLYEAVTSLKPDRDSPVHILYAGSGPFAALILPLLTIFKETAIQVTILEINPVSFAGVQQVIAKLGFNKYIKTFENTDATQYRVNQADRIDLVLCETMQHALIKEQQVPIMMNLLSQLPADVMVIPQKIELELGLFNSRKYMEMLTGDPGIIYYKKIGKVFELSKKGMHDFHTGKNPEDVPVFPEITIQLAPGVTAGYDRLMILTEIQIYGEERLSINESGLTLPLMLEDIEYIKDKEITVKLQYKTGREPGWIYNLTY